jgi:hypothetical protein
MKPLLLSILLFTLPFAKGPKAPKADLLGKWKLVKAEVNGETVLPTAYTYTLGISDSALKYNIECNDCYVDVYSENESIITISHAMGCTAVNCFHTDPITPYMNYCGSYKIIDDSVLQITNTKATLYLTRLSHSY